MRTLQTIIMASVCCAVLAGITGCSSSKNAMMTSEERWARAKESFADGSYYDAIEDLKILTMQFQGSAFGDSAQFLLANSYYKRKEYILSQFEFENMIRSRTGSRLLPQARYLMAMCLYNLSSQSTLDQANTHKAIDAFQSYIEYSPADSLVPKAESLIRELNNRLAEREYQIANLYMRMGYYRAASLYYDALLEKYHDSDLADDAQLEKATAMFNRKKYPEAMDEVQKFLDRYPSSPRRSEGEQLLKDIQSQLQTAEKKK